MKINKAIVTPFAVLSLSLIAFAAQAQGVDTGASSMKNVDQWLRTWIPLGAGIGILIMAFAWFFHVIRVDWAFRGIIALIVAGSGSYIVSLFGFK